MSQVAENTAEPRRNPGHALTGVLSWASIVVAVLGCLVFPRVWMVIATIFLVYFIARLCVTTVFALIGQRKIHEWEKRDWTADEDVVGAYGFAPSDVRHVVIVPTYKEPAEIINRTLDALAAQHRADERLIVVLGMEEREADARAKSEKMIASYSGRFLHMMATIHPGNIAGEEPGKSSNEAWAGRRARTAIDDLGIDPALATITSCDADSVLNPSYFSAVAASFAAEERRHLSFWQAPIFFYNNIWQVPAPVRFTTWMQHAAQLSELAAAPWFDSLPISTYTLSLQLCERCGWWDPAVIPEDWHSYLNCLFETGDEIAVHPIFLPTFGDATDGDGMRDAVKNRFEQLKRHSWGAEDVGFIWGQLTERKHNWRSSTIFRFTQVLHDHSMRVINWVVLTSAYILAAYFSRLHWYDLGWRSSVAENLMILNILFTLGTVIMLTSILLELWRCPPPDNKSRLGTALEIMVLWLLLPVLGLVLGMLPALSAQTRLMVGIPLGYKVTPKRFAEPITQKAS